MRELAMFIKAVFLPVLLVTTTVSNTRAQSFVPSAVPRNLPVAQAKIFTTLDLFNFPLVEEFEIVGNPYLEKDFSKGNVYTRKGVFSGIDMRYHIYYDRIEFKQNDSIYTIGPDTTIVKIELGNQILVVDAYKFKDKIFLGYFSMLESGAMTLMTKMVVILTERQAAKPIQTEGLPPRFDRARDLYFYKIGDGPLRQITSINDVIQTLPDNKMEMEKFTDKEKVSPKRKEGLTNFVRYYNSLPR